MNKEYRLEKIEIDGNINLRDELEKFLIHWKWFVVSVVIMLFVGLLYIRYTPPSYKITTTVLIKEDESSFGSELSAFQDLAVFGGAGKNITNEIELLKSRSLLKKVILDLELNISAYVDGYVKDFELHKDRLPFKLVTLNSTEKLYNLDTLFYIRIVDDYTFDILNKEESFVETKKINEVFKLKDFEFKLASNVGDESSKFDAVKENKNIKFKISPIDGLIESYSERIKIELVDQLSSVLKISLNHSVKNKGQEILDKLVANYNVNAITDKSEVGNSTSDFIRKRLEIISKELSVVDKDVEIYKKENHLTDIEAESRQFLLSVSESEKELLDVAVQIRLVNFMDNYLKENNQNFELIPSNLGFKDLSIDQLAIQYNNSVLERKKILINSSINNPIVKNIESRLTDFQKNLKQSLLNLKASLQISLKELENEDYRLNTEIASIPKKEREYKKIQRQQTIKEALYLYLLQKKEETEISLAVTVADAKIIDKSFVSYRPIAPNKKLILVGSMFVGLLIPFSILYLINLLDTKLHTRKDMEQSVSAPILGDIPINDSDDNIVVKEGGRSSIAEAFRLLRTNLDFMLTGVESNCKSIFVTSTTSGEGKSFVSVNLACTLALSGKKVALLGMDLRAPKITEYLGIPNTKGVTNCIKDTSLNILDLKFNIEGYSNLDIFSSGIIPPNPAELLLNPRVQEMFDTLKEEYDYIVVDTAPVNLVTDTLLVSKYADMFIYVARAGYLDKRLLAIPQNLYTDKRLPNMAMLINASDYKKSYGYGAYGAYGYGEPEPLPWWKKILS